MAPAVASAATDDAAPLVGPRTEAKPLAPATTAEATDTVPLEPPGGQGREETNTVPLEPPGGQGPEASATEGSSSDAPLVEPEGSVPSGSGAPVVQSAPQIGVPVTAATSETATSGNGNHFDRWKSVEDVPKRNAKSTTYRNPDGTFTTDVATRRRHYESKPGKWAVLDTTLTGGLPGTSLPTVRNVSGPFRVDFAKRAGGAPLGKLTVGGGSISFDLVGARPVAAQIDGDKALYADVLEDIDVELVSTESGVKESIILKTPRAARQLRFNLRLDRLTLQQVASGALEIRDRSGRVVGELPQGWMEDAGSDPVTGTGFKSTDVRYGFDSARSELTITADNGWLNDPNRVFPVVVDPTLTMRSDVAAFGDDTFVMSPYKNDNSGSGDLKVGPAPDSSSVAAAYVKFDIPFSMIYQHVVAAEISAINWHTGGNCAELRPVSVYRVTAPWNGSELTEWPGAAYDDNPLDTQWASYGYGCDAQWMTWRGERVTTTVRDWVHGRAPGYGVTLRVPPEYDNDRPWSWKKFISRNSPYQGPTLTYTWNGYDATYDAVPNTLVLPTATTTGSEKITVTNRAQEKWSANSTIRLSYHIVNNATNVTTFDGARTALPRDVAYGESVTLDAKIDPLLPGRYTIQWDMVHDGVTWFSSQWVPMVGQTFTVPNLPPSISDASPKGVVNSLRPTLSVVAADTDKWPAGDLKYEFRICTGKDVQSGSCRDSGTITQNSWTVPAGALSWRQTYYWTVKVTDPAGAQTSFAVPGRFTPVVPQPDNSQLGGGASDANVEGVSLYNGNAVLSVVDITMEGAGPTPAVARSYNSLDPRVLPFGTGWTNTYDMVAVTDTSNTNGDVLLTYPTGQQVRFGKNAEGTYAAPAGSFAQLAAVVGGGYKLIDQAGMTYVFGATGQLTSIIDPFGRRQTVAYSSGRLSKVTSSVSGRALTFLWTGSHITAVSTQNVAANGTQPYTWTYEYTGDQLTKVCGPKGATACTKYSYGSVGGRQVLTSTTMPKGNVTNTFAYSADTATPPRITVTSRTDGASKKWTYTYKISNGLRKTFVKDPYGQTEGWSFDAPGRLVAHQDALGNVRSISYDDLGNAIRTVDENGKFTLSSFDNRGNQLSRTTPRTTAPAFAATVKAGPAPLAWWRLGEWSGTQATDASGNGRDGQYNGNVALGSAGALATDASSSATFSGDKQYVKVADGSWQSITGDLTLSGWVRIDGTSRFQVVATKGEAPSGVSYALRINDGKELEYYHGTGSGWEHHVTPYPFQVGRWYQVAVTRGGNKVKLFVNGALVALQDQTAAPVAASGGFYIGSSSTTLDFLKGGLQDVLVYGQVLTDNQIRDQFGAGRNTAYRNVVTTGSVAPLAWYRLADTNGTAVDSSGNNRHAVYEGSVSRGGPSAIAGDSADRSAGFGPGLGAVHLPSGFSDFSNGLSLEAWVNPSQTPTGWSRVFDLGNPDDTHSIVLSRIANSNDLAFQIWGGADGHDFSQWLQVPGVFENNVWKHIVVTLDVAANATVYVNGAPVARGNVGRMPAPVARTQAYIGRSSLPGGEVFLGRIDEAAVYGRPLGADEIAAHYAAGAAFAPNDSRTMTTTYSYSRTPYSSAPLADNPAGYWRLGEAAGTVAADASGKGHNGVVADGVSRISMGAIVNDSDGSMVGATGGTVSGSGIPTPLTGFTFETWVNIPDLQRNGTFVSSGSGPSHDVSLGVGKDNFDTPGNKLIGLYEHACWINSGANIGTGWHHVAMRVNVNKSASFYIDGVRVATKTACAPLAGRDDQWAVGGVAGQQERRSVGIGFDEAAIYTTPLTDARIREHYLVGVQRNVGDLSSDRLIAERDPRSSSAADTAFTTTYRYTAEGVLAETRTPRTAACPSGCTSTTDFSTGTEPAIGGGTMPRGLRIRQTNARGQVTQFAYDAKGDLRETINPLGAETSNTYDELGNQVTETTELGTTSRTYDAWGKVLTVREPATRNHVTDVVHTKQTTNSYDENERLVSERVADLSGGDAERITNYQYDGNDRRTVVVDAGGNKTTTVFDAYGNPNQVTAPNGAVTEYGYTARRELWTTTIKNFVDDPFANGGSGTAPRDVLLESRSYDPAGRLASRTDAVGRRHDFAYFADGLLQFDWLRNYQRTDGSKADYIIDWRNYDAAGHLVVSLTNNATTKTELQYDALGRTLSAKTGSTTAVMRTSTYTYDPNGNVVTATANGGGRTDTKRFSYDAADNRLAEVTGDVATRAMYDANGRVQKRIDGRGQATEFAYDESGRPWKVMQPSVSVEQGGVAGVARPTQLVGYDNFGSVTHERNARGDVTVTAYDNLGRRQRVEQPAYTPPGGVTLKPATTYAYDKLGNLRSVTDPRGKTTTIDNDLRGRAVRVTGPQVAGLGAPVTRRAYDDAGNVTTTVSPTGATVAMAYDEVNRLRSQAVQERVPTARQLQTTFTYNELATPPRMSRTVTTPANEQWEYGLDPFGNTTSVRAPSGATATTVFDGSDRTVSQTDPLNRKTTYTYNAVGYATAKTEYDRNGAVVRATSYVPDANGNVTQELAPNGGTTTTVYDNLNRPQQVTQVVDGNPANDITVSLGYDALGNRTRLTDARGNTTTTSYNALGLVESVVEPATATYKTLDTRKYTTKYDAGGLPVEVGEPGNVVQSKSYNDLGALISEVSTVNGRQSATRTFGRDLEGRVTSLAAPSGTTNISYDARGNVVSASGASGNSTFAYDANGRMIQRTDAAGVTKYTWNADGLLATVAEPLTGTTRTNSYDAAGELTGTEFGSGKAKRAFGYDDLGRVTSDVVNNGAGKAIASSAYGYDLNGNVTSKTLGPAGVPGAGTHTYEYDRADRLVSWTAPNDAVTPYGWDPSGNRTSAGATTATYDERNQLVSEVTGSTTTSFGYSARGTIDRTTKVVNGGAPVVTDLTFDGFDRLVSDGARTYAYDSLDRLASGGTSTLSYAGLQKEPVGDGTSVFARDPDGGLLATRTGSSSGATVQNPHGDLTATVDPSGSSVSGARAYDPFGTVTATSGANLPSLGYQGQWTDPVTAKTSMQARWYMPGQSAFVSRDSWTLPASSAANVNRMTYANANPVTHADPSGHCICILIVGGGIIVVGGYCHFHSCSPPRAPDIEVPHITLPWSGSHSGSHSNTGTRTHTGAWTYPWTGTFTSPFDGSWGPPTCEYWGIRCPPSNTEEGNGPNPGCRGNCSRPRPRPRPLPPRPKVNLNTLKSIADPMYGGEALAPVVGSNPIEGVLPDAVKALLDQMGGPDDGTRDDPKVAGKPDPNDTRNDDDKECGGQPRSAGDAAVRAARGAQNSGGYTEDSWQPVCLRAGTKIWAGTPGVSGFFGTAEGARRAGRDAQKWNEGLQVAPGPLDSPWPNQYRRSIGMFEVENDRWAASSVANANQRWGVGGYEQYYVPGWQADVKLRGGGTMTNIDARDQYRRLSP